MRKETIEMKNSLEYKILKYLKEKDNGNFIDMRNFIKDRKLLESKLHSLSKEPEKYISTQFPLLIFNAYSSNTDDTLKAKIEFKGIKLLSEIENQDFFLESPFINKTNVAPNIKPETKSLFKKIYSSPWVLLIAGCVITAILNAKKIRDWIDTLF